MAYNSQLTSQFYDITKDIHTGWVTMEPKAPA